MDASRVAGRLWPIAGDSIDLLRLSATLEHGTPEQVSACIPAAVALDGIDYITDADVQAALRAHPPLRSHHRQPVHLRNLVRKIVNTCFMSQRPSNRAIDPIGHVLNKAWPMRCSVRNFSDIVSSYIIRDPDVYRFICAAMHTCMLGTYPTSTVTAQLRLRMILHRYYVAQCISQQHLAEWVRQDNHGIVFVAIKEYIVFAVSMVPGLASVLHAYYNWADFVSSVSSQADAIRTALNDNMECPEIMFSAARLSITYSRCFKCPTPTTDMGALCDTVATIIRTKCVPRCNVYTRPQRMAIYNHIREPLALGAPIDKVALAMGLPAQAAQAISGVVAPGAPSSAWRALRRYSCTDDEKALLIHEFVCAWTMSAKIRTFPLPPHIKRAQQRAQLDRSTVVYACTCCRQLRAFVIDEGSAAGNAWACGHQKVLLDDATGVLYCGKRVEKASSQSRRMRQTNDSGRSYWKAQQSMMCGYCPLLKLEMVGTLLCFYGKLYMLCPSCMGTMRLTHERYRGDSIRCVNCQYRGNSAATIGCFHCCASQVALRPITLQGLHMHVCDGCTRKWMDDESLMAGVTEDIAHQAINERWGTNRLLVHCMRT